MKNLINIIKNNDSKISNDENDLINLINSHYESAVHKAELEFEKLISENGNLNSRRVKQIIKNTMKEFESEFSKIKDPITESMKKSYEDGLEETAEILAARSQL